MEEVTIRRVQLIRWEAIGGSLCLTTLTSVLDLRHLPYDEFERFWSDLDLWIAARRHTRARCLLSRDFVQDSVLPN